MRMMSSAWAATLYYTDTNDINGEIGAFDPATQINTMYHLPEYPPPAT